MSERIVARIETALREFHLSSDQPVLVACSGGSDSVALLHALVASGPTFPIILAHVEHGIRDAPVGRVERSVIDRLGRDLGVPVRRSIVAPGEIHAVAVRERRSLEEVARDYRYRLLGEIAAGVAREHAGRYPSDTRPEVPVLTAHHVQDQTETVLMRMCTGRSPLDTPTIKNERLLTCVEVDLRILRPALHILPEELGRYLDRHKVPFVYDSSNDDQTYLRNRVRAQLLPALETVFGAPVSANVAAYGEAITDLYNGLVALIPDDGWGRVEGDRWVIRNSRFMTLPVVAREIVLRRALYAISGSSRVAFRPFRPIVTGGTGVRPGGVTAGGVTARYTSQGQLLLYRDIVRTGRIGYLWKLDTDTSLLVRWTGDSVQLADDAGTEGQVWCFGPVCGPLVLRSRRPGDGVMCDGRLRDTRDILSVSDLGPELRQNVPILEDTHGIVTILGPRGPICTRDGVEYNDGTKQRRDRWVSLRVAYEETEKYAER